MLRPPAILIASLLAAACSGREAANLAELPSPRGGPSPSLEAPSHAEWEGIGSFPPSGELPVDGFNAYLAAARPSSARSAIRTALEFVRAGDPEGPSVLTAEARAGEDGRVVVTATHDRLPDDSVRAARFVIGLERRGNVWRLRSARWSQRCWEGRGHQNFSTEPCI